MKSRTTSLPAKEVDTKGMIIDLAYSFRKSKILLTANELGIFTVLGNESRTAKEIAHDIDADPGSTEKLLNALCSIGLTYKQGDEYMNSKGARWYLVKQSPDFIGDLNSISSLWDKFGQLTDIVKKGEIDEENEEKQLEMLVAGEFDIQYRFDCKCAPEVVQALNLSKVNKILMLGDNAGIYTREFLDSKPELKIDMMILPSVVKKSLGLLEAAGINDKVRIIEGNPYIDELTGNYDLVVCSMFLHRHSLWNNINLMQKTYDIINSGGNIAIHDYVLNDQRTGPEDSAVKSLSLMLETKGGEVYTHTDLWITMREGWYRDVKHIDTSMGTSLFTGLK